MCYERKREILGLLKLAGKETQPCLVGARATDAKALSFNLGRTGGDRLGRNLCSGVFAVHHSRRDRHPASRSVASRPVDVPIGVSGELRWLLALESRY
jgi:hypothetical protein